MKLAWVCLMTKPGLSVSHYHILRCRSHVFFFVRILQVLCAKLRLEDDFNFTALAKATAGYVGADLAALTGAAGIIAVKQIFKQLSCPS